MAIKPFNSVGGYSIGPNLEVVIDQNGSATFLDVTVSGGLTLTAGDTQLGNVDTVHIDGGTAGQYLQTDGSGNLTWATVDTDTLANGSSNVSIDTLNGPVTIGVNGTSNVAIISDTFANFAGNISAVGNVTADSLYANIEANVGNLVVLGTSNLQSDLTVGGTFTLTGDANLNNSLFVNSDISANGILTVGGDANLTNALFVGTDTYGGGNITANGDIKSNGGVFIGDAYGLANVQGANVTGTVANANYSGTSLEVANGTSSVTIPVASSNVETRVNGILVIDTSDLQTSFLSNTVSVNYDLNAGNRVYANSIEAGGAITASTIEAYGSLTTAFFTSTMGASFYDTVSVGSSLSIGTTLDVTNEANIGGNLAVTGDITTQSNLSVTGGIQAFDASLVDLYLTGLSQLGDVTNVHIDGGTNGQYLSTDGAGNLTWSTIDTDTLANGTSNVSIDTLNGPVTIGVAGNANVAVFSGTGLTVQSNITATNITATGGVSTANLTANALVTLGAVGNVKITGGANGLALTTDGTGNLAWTNQSLKYTREWHIDPTVGNDTTGTGSYNFPFATIAKVKAVIGTQTGQTIYLHNGVYSENVTWTVGNTDFVYTGDGGLAYCTGTWGFSHSTPGSVRVLNLQFEGIVTVSGTGSVYFGSCNLVGGLNKTGNGYIEMRNDTMVSDTTSFVSITGSGIVNMLGGAANSITVNNAGAQFVARDATLAIITVTSGLALVDTSFIYPATATTNAVTSTSAGIFYAYNSHFVTTSGALARVSLAGAWTLNDVQYDKANSTLTGTNLGTISYFDALNTQSLANVGSLTVRSTSSLGAVGNITITGGSAGQYLQTNGSGVLSWSTAALSGIANGTSNVRIASTNGNAIISVNGQGNIVTVASNGVFATTTINDDVIVTGNLTVQGNTISVNVTELNVEDPIITEGRGPNNTPLTSADGKDRGLFSYYYDGAEKAGFIGLMTTGTYAGDYVVSTDATVSNNVVTVNSYGNIAVGNVIGNLANGTSSVGIAGVDGDITLSVNGTANVVVASVTGIDVTGVVKVRTVTSIDASTATTTSTTPTVVAEVDYADGLAVEFLVKGRDTIAAVSEVNTVMAVCEGGGADHTIYGSVNSGAAVGSFTVAVNAGKLQLIATAASANSTTWTVQYRTV